MISAGRSGRIRFDDLIAAIRDCQKVGGALRKKARLDADDVLYKLSAAVYNGRSTIEATFRQFDADRQAQKFDFFPSGYFETLGGTSKFYPGYPT